ncbi:MULTISPECIES: ankyrin repeat domain-containing protein [unclassified Clostridium]|uniref:ankyrin repeat domain-containing protein n=1 Tax=unclassified Clostridium TaxID=2614128 RepID=UPI000297D3ED|nr:MULTISPECIES: ankyrin repeat domain-containing protein [unclassified Clostridium]EKQ51577.1 MAG: hypothetical protein A370_04755 [Clostridium sp. Maddingley MBC34-26]
MSYFEDLTNYSYFFYENSKNVGWLDKTYTYAKGRVSKEFIDNLWEYMQGNLEKTRGYHNCNLCSVFNKEVFTTTHKGNSVKLGSGEIRVLSENGKISYSAPNLIYHYIVNHEYKPPDEFVQAVLKGPKPGSSQYEKFLSSFREDTLEGKYIKNIHIVQRGGEDDYVEAAREFHTAILQNDLKRVSELINTCEEKITMIIELSKWLYIAASEGKLEAVKYLISSGVKMDVSIPANNPLFGAICRGHVDVVKLLIESGIDTNVKYSNEFMRKMDALALAEQRGQVEIVSLLEERRFEKKIKFFGEDFVVDF